MKLDQEDRVEFAEKMVDFHKIRYRQSSEKVATVNKLITDHEKRFPDDNDSEAYKNLWKSFSKALTINQEHANLVIESQKVLQIIKGRNLNEGSQ